jgi:hypothetical protein
VTTTPERIDVGPPNAAAREAHTGATLIALLVMLWGGVSLFFVPRETFAAPNIVQVLVCGPAFVYFLATRKRPSRRVATTFSAVALAYSLALLPWTAVVWCALGRPWEALTVPQIASVGMALVIPSRPAIGVTLLLLFAAEGIFAIGYARHVGLSALVPVTEPYATLSFAALGLGLFVSRRRRQALAEQFIVVQSETEALRRVAPLFASVREDLDTQLGIIDAEIEQLDERNKIDPAPATIGRARVRLSELSGKLDALASDPAGESCQDAEKRLLDRDAQTGVTIMTAIGATANLLGLFIAIAEGAVPAIAFLAKVIFDGAMLAQLVRTRHRPSRRRATWLLILLFATSLPLICSNQLLLMRLQRPYTPFLGHKVAMVALGITAASRFGLSLALILVTAIAALALYVGLDLAAHKDVTPIVEPWVTMVFLLIALLSLWMREQRRVASLRLLRAETQATALHRRARMVLALRDRINSPLQILVVSAGRTDSQLPAESRKRIQDAVSQLTRLSRQLSRLDALIPERSQTPSLDADRELRRTR